MTTTQAPPEPASVPLRDVERELGRQLKVLQGEDGPVQRVHMSNLVIFCNHLETAERISSQVPDIVMVHPARVLLLVADENITDGNIQATVCVRPLATNGKRHACCEQVTLKAAPAGVHRLPFAVRALQIGDLPTNLWWASNQPPPLAGDLLMELAEYAEQIVYDSIGWPEPARGVAATARWLENVERGSGSGRWRVASDLNWRRLKYWRRLAAQGFEPGSNPGAVETISEVLVEHGPHAVIQCWELVSWISHKLGWQVQEGKTSSGSEMGWTFRADQGDVCVRVRRLAEGPPVIHRLRVACKLEGKPGALDMTVKENNRLAIALEGTSAEPRTVTIPPQSPGELVGRQLSDRERDPVFRESMAVAQVLAQSMLS